MSGGARGHGSALAPALLLAAVFLGMFLFAFLISIHREPIRLDVSTPALDKDPPLTCKRPCYTVTVTNVGGAAGNVLCQARAPALFPSGEATLLGVAPLQPEDTWVVYVSSQTKDVPASPPGVSCVPF